MKNHADAIDFTQLFVPQAAQSSHDRRAESEIQLAIPSMQSVCGMENNMKKIYTEENNDITVAGIQIFCNKRKCDMLQKAEEQMEKAVKTDNNIDLFVLPEQFYQMTCNNFNDEKYGEMPHQEFEIWVKHCAVKYNANIVAGTYSVITDNSQKVMNRCLVCDRKGNIVGFYDKIHLFDAFGIKESDTFAEGNSLGIFDLDIGRVGVWICYDSRFPEIARALRAKGADILCVPAAFYRPNTDQWDILIKSAAICNVTPVLAVNQYGDLPDGKGLFGRSMLVDAKGVVTAGMSDKEGFFIGKIDKTFTEKCRYANPELNNRRKELYREWL